MHDRPQQPRPGDRVNLAAFALKRWWTGTEQHDLHIHDLKPDASGCWKPERDPATGLWHIGLEWPDPRDIRQVALWYADLVPPGLQLQYWQKNWPTPAPERRTGARRGWIGRDDPWHGRWTTVRARQTLSQSLCTWDFDPLDLAEMGERESAARLEEAEHYLARFRRTLKIRLVSEGQEQPAITEFGAYSDSVWQEKQIVVRLGLDQDRTADWSGHAQVLNGYVTRIEPCHLERIQAADRWLCPSGTQTEGIRLGLLCTDAGPASADRTIVTICTRAYSFSFLIADLARGPIYIKDYGVVIAWAGDEIDATTLETRLAAMPTPIYDRVESEPEHSLARAMCDIPPLDVVKQDSYTGLGRYLPLGLEAGRQEWALRHNGDLFADKVQLKLRGRDAARLLWPGRRLHFRFASGDPPTFHEHGDDTRQSLQEGWLPVVISQWLDREIAYEQTTFVAPLTQPVNEPSMQQSDPDVVAMSRFVIRNTTLGRKRAHLWVVISPSEQLELRQGLVLAHGRVVPAEPVARQWRVQPYECAYLRCAVDSRGRGNWAAGPFAKDTGTSMAVPTAILYSVELEGGEEHTVTMAMPFPTLVEPDEWQQARELGFQAKLDEVVSYWRGYVESGGYIDVPDRVLSDFHKAVRVHVAITADRDPTSGLIALPAATYSYGVCANEACWQITMLDQAGHHDRARRYLETFLATQGASWLDGDFGSNEGVMQGLDFDAGVPMRSGFAYNLDHGYILECLANHYRMTGDQSWLCRVSPNLVSACDFIIRERKRTQIHNPEGQPSTAWGLLPAGHLEDNPEWRHWFAVNAHAYHGMHSVAEALLDIEHPEAGRLIREAEAYRLDIRSAAQRAMVESPVVRLLNGTYIPHVPTRTHIRGREWGWFREAAYGALHLLEGDVFSPDEKEMTWILKDLEDNLFVSREWGRPVDLERHWFSHGGVTIQPNLMDLAIDYLRRGQIKHALRALFNNLGVSLYPDVRTFTEHPVVELGHGVGPFYKSSDEAKALTWLRAFLIWEIARDLHLAMGAPSAWFEPGRSFGVHNMATHFGPLTYRVTSTPSQTRIYIDVPDRSPIQDLWLHIRHSEDRRVESALVEGCDCSEWDGDARIMRIAAPKGIVNIAVNYVR